MRKKLEDLEEWELKEAYRASDANLTRARTRLRASLVGTQERRAARELVRYHQNRVTRIRGLLQRDAE